MRVLVVEDEKALCQIFGEFFRGLGHEPLLTHTAEAALETLSTTPPDAVLLDVYLPGMNGLEFLETITGRGATVPVVAMSGIASEAQARECLRLGAVEFMGKPVVLERLGEMFARIERGTVPRAPDPRQIDRRRAPRAAVSLPIWIRDADGGEWEGTTVDVSDVGVRVRPDAPITTRAMVTISLVLPDGQAPLEIEATLARRDGAMYAYDFLEATPAQRARLRGLVTRFRAIDGGSREPHAGILHTIGEALRGTLDVDRVLATALDALTRVTGHEVSSLHLVSPDGRTLHLHGDRGLSPRLRELNRTLDVGVGVIGRVAATGETAQHADVRNARDLLPAARALVMEEGIRAFICVAIRSRGRVLGTLGLGRRTSLPFSAEDAELLEASADHLGLALENSRLYEETRVQLGRLEQAERRLAEGERLSTLGRLAAGVAHEINNPLGAILGQAELLMLQGAVLPSGVERVRVIIEETARAARLLQGLLRLGHRRRPMRRPCALDEQVDAVLRLKEHDLRRAGIEVVRTLARVARVWADEDQVRQVLLNLVQNAEQAMAGRPGRKVLTVRVVASSDRARVEVLDTGPGIEPDVLPRIFDAFFTTKRPDEGTGLGLWLAYEIAEQHDGRLHAENRPEGGAVFVLELPYGRRGD